MKLLGDPFIPFLYGQQFPFLIAEKFNISLIMYGENGEVEYGGKNLRIIKTKEWKAKSMKIFFLGNFTWWNDECRGRCKRSLLL